MSPLRDPYQFTVRSTHEGHVTVTFTDPAEALRAYQRGLPGHLHRLLRAATVQLVYEGKPFGCPFPHPTSRSQVQS